MPAPHNVLPCGGNCIDLHAPKAVAYHEQSQYCRYMVGHSLGRMVQFSTVQGIFKVQGIFDWPGVLDLNGLHMCGIRRLSLDLNDPMCCIERISLGVVQATKQSAKVRLQRGGANQARE